MGSILVLPRGLRKRVYIESGVVSGRAMDLSAPFRKWKRDFRGPAGPASDPRHPPDTRQTLVLLLVCRAVSREVAELFYSTNKFFITFVTPNDLLPLRSLSAYALSQMTELGVQLCAKPQRYFQRLLMPVNEALSLESARGQTALREWSVTVNAIAPHIRPGRLKLYLVCDVSGVPTADAFMAELLRLPSLASCYLRLAGIRNNELQRPAREYALQAVRAHAKASASFPFADLPREIRLDILEYTDLVAPRNEVKWDNEAGWYLDNQPHKCASMNPSEMMPTTCSPDQHHECRVPCASRNPLLKWPARCKPGRDQGCLCIRPCLICSAAFGCFCQRWHSAYATDATWCGCWQPPVSLFLVSKAFHREAQEVFLSRNRIIVVASAPRPGTAFPNPSWPHDTLPEAWAPRGWRPVTPPSESEQQSVESTLKHSSSQLSLACETSYRYSAATFLTEAIKPLSSLRHIRHLELHFPPICDVTTAHGVWCLHLHQAITAARPHFNPAALTVQVCVERSYGPVARLPLHQEYGKWNFENMGLGWRHLCMLFKPLLAGQQKGPVKELGFILPLPQYGHDDMADYTQRKRTVERDMQKLLLDAARAEAGPATAPLPTGSEDNKTAELAPCYKGS